MRGRSRWTSIEHLEGGVRDVRDARDVRAPFAETAIQADLAERCADAEAGRATRDEEDQHDAMLRDRAHVLAFCACELERLRRRGDVLRTAREYLDTLARARAEYLGRALSLGERATLSVLSVLLFEVVEQLGGWDRLAPARLAIATADRLSSMVEAA